MAAPKKIFEKSIEEFTSNKVNKVRWLPGYSNDTFQIVTGGWDEDTTSPVSLWSFKLPLHNEDDLDEYGMMIEDDEYDLQVSESIEVAGSVMDMAVYQNLVFTATSTGHISSFRYTENSILPLRSVGVHKKGAANAIALGLDTQDNLVRVATGGEDGRICILSKDLQTVEAEKKLESSVNGLAFRDTDTVFSVHTSGFLSVWDIRDSNSRFTFTDTTHRQNTLHSVGIYPGPNKDIVVAGSSSGSILIWDIRKLSSSSKHTLCRFQQHTSNVWEVKVLEPRSLMTCSSDKRVLQWDLKRAIDGVQSEFSQVFEVTRCQQIVNSFDYNSTINAVVVAAENDLLRIVYE